MHHEAAIVAAVPAKDIAVTTQPICTEHGYTDLSLHTIHFTQCVSVWVINNFDYYDGSSLYVVGAILVKQICFMLIWVVKFIYIVSASWQKLTWIIYLKSSIFLVTALNALNV
jgi:hypothetical protein